MSSKRPVGGKKKFGAQSQSEQSQPTFIGPSELRRLQSSMTRPVSSPSLSLDHGAARQLQFDAASAQFPPFTRPPPVRPQFMPTPRMPQYEPSYAHAQASFSQSPQLEPSPSQPYHARASFSQSPQLEPSPSGAADEATPSSQPSGDDDGGDVDPDVASTSTLDPDGLW